MKKIILFIAVFFYCFNLTYAQPGQLDSSFGTNGFIEIKDSSGTARQVLPQSDGSSYVIISKKFTQTYICKRKPDGSVDASYGNNSFSDLVDIRFSKAIFQSDGKIIVVGESNYNFAVARYNTDGTLDKSFAKDGMQVTDGGSGATSVAVQKNGKIVVAGEAYNSNGITVFALARYNTNGSLDSSFSKNGTETTEFDRTALYATSVAIQSNGKIVLGGIADGAPFPALILARYNTDGKQDSTFGNNAGFAIVDDGTANEIAIQPDDKIVVAGGTFTDYDGSYETYETHSLHRRFNADGSADTTFLPPYTTYLGHEDRFSSLAIQTDGKIIIGGNRREGVGRGFTLVRYNTNGSKDSTFSAFQVTDLNGEGAFLQNVAIANNKLYAAGDGIVARFFLDNGNKTPFVTLTIADSITKYMAPARIRLNAAVANASAAITKVRFYNGSTWLHTETAAPYGFLWTGVPAGNYTLIAKAYDAAGNVITSNAIKVSVTLPVVSIVNPMHDTTLSGPATIRLIARAKDAYDRISKVEFFNGAVLLRTEYYYPYTYNWINIQPGTYTITAKATNSCGFTTTSAPVKITVTNASSRPIVENNKTGISLKLSPNPANNILQITTNGFVQGKAATISIISASGVVMKTIQANNQNQQIDISSIASGVYTVKVVSGDKTMYKQFVKL